MHSARKEKRSFDKLRTSGAGSVTLVAEVFDKMFEATKNAHPHEACGILLGEGARIAAFRQTENVHPDPATHFEIDPQALIDVHRDERAGGPHILGYFHSHPAGQAIPSETDAGMAAHDGKIWAILAGDTVRLWRDDPEGFAELSYDVVER